MVGTPVIISDQTPWRGMEEAGVGWDIALSDKHAFTNAIRRIIEMDSNKFGDMEVRIIGYINKIMNFQELKDKYTKAISEV